MKYAPALSAKREGKYLSDCLKQSPWNCSQPFNLPDKVIIAERPRAKVLAVVRQDAVVGFAQARARPRHHFATVEALRAASNPDGVASSETLERNLFHRSAPEPVCKTSVVNDASVADVDAVVRVERARCDEMRRKWGFGA